MPKRTRRKPEKTAADETLYEPRSDFPIVGIGASAGGLEALEQFLGKVPPDSGMAFVVIQHLDPTRKGIMPELLRRVCQLPVVQGSDRLRVKPNHVYVIPPNRDMSILEGCLQLFEPTETRGLRLPIDFFFRALAEDRGPASVGVILSGMGSDGTLGLRAIKDKAGLTLVQEAASAKFDGMPGSAIAAGVADIVAPADELAEKLIAAVQHGQALPTSADEQRQSALDKIVVLLRSKTGHDFSQYKKSTMYRRIERRMGIHLIPRISDYVRYLRENPQELDLLFRELLIGVTSFFRDPEAWESLKTVALPTLLANAGLRKELRAWVPACSTGEEAYSLAIVFKEAMDALQPDHPFTLQIYATDLDGHAIDVARRGTYPKNICADVTPERLSRFFVSDDHGYRISAEIRETVIFAQQNLISDPPFTKLDILSCRNLLIYLTAELQKRLIPLFFYSLNEGGVLFLGTAETVSGAGDLFTPLEGKARLYLRNPEIQRVELEFPPARIGALPFDLARREAHPQAPKLEVLADQVLLRRFSPAAVLTNDQGDILYINGRTGDYLEPASGKAHWNIYSMARDALRFELISVFQKALRQKGVVTIPNVPVDQTEGSRRINLLGEALLDPEAMRGTVLLVFQELPEVPAAAGGKRRGSARGTHAAELESEVSRLREELQSTREEMQSSQEELKSANEELQSTNEELQSTNEELTTSKEEMQSLNEELQTVNAELQSKLDDLSRASNDMNNLMNSTEIATVFLDNQMHIRRYTIPSTRIIKLIPSDIGRLLSDIATDLRYPELYADAEEVLRTLVFSQKDIPTEDGLWFSVRIMPYRTADNVIDGVVITFNDITVAKTLEAKLREAAGMTSESGSPPCP